MGNKGFLEVPSNYTSASTVPNSLVSGYLQLVHAPHIIKIWLCDRSKCVVFILITYIFTCGRFIGPHCGFPDWCKIAMVIPSHFICLCRERITRYTKYLKPFFSLPSLILLLLDYVHVQHVVPIRRVLLLSILRREDRR